MNLFYSTRAEEDVNIDSDEEPDFDKMDLVIFSKSFLFFKLRFLFILRVVKKVQLVDGILIQMKNIVLI
jgi:hypothetical protein